VYERRKRWTQINDEDETILISNERHICLRSQKERRMTREMFSFTINIIRRNTRQYIKLLFFALPKKKRKKVYSLRVAANQTVHCQVTTINTNHAFARHVSKNNAYAKFTRSHARQCALPLHLLFCLVALYWSISCTKLSEHSLKHYFCFPYTNIPLLLEKPTGNTADSDLFALTYHIKINMQQR